MTSSLTNPLVQQDLAGAAREIALRLPSIASATLRARGRDSNDANDALAIVLALALYVRGLCVAHGYSTEVFADALEVVFDDDSTFNRIPPHSDLRAAALYNRLIGD